MIQGHSGPSYGIHFPLKAGIEVLTPARPSEPEFLARLTELAPDCAPVVA